MSAFGERRINTKAQSMLLNAIARHIQEVQVRAIVIVEDDSCSYPRLPVQ
jgi:hypothetical protein